MEDYLGILVAQLEVDYLVILVAQLAVVFWED